ncbi:MAG: gamma-glutamyltransferase [Pseudomonadota bacterium]
MVKQIEQWSIAKPIAAGKSGVVAAQHAGAAQIGADILAAGGNAVDAAVATACALSVLEPWMSGLGGGGYMVVYLAAEKRCQVIDFGMIAPRQLDPAAFPLIEGAAGVDDDLFGWPAVVEDRNLHGPLSIAVPGSVEGLGLAIDRFGRMPWAEVLQPAVELARVGHPMSFWSTLKICDEAAALACYSAARDRYLPGGLPPIAYLDSTNHLPMHDMAATLDHLARAGHRDFYEGDLATSILRDLAAVGTPITAEDLAGYRAHLADPLVCERGEVRYHLPPGLTAGPTFAEALALLPPQSSLESAAYLGFARALTQAYESRLARMGHDGDQAGQGCTTHLCIADEAGNLVALTNTLLSLFGSKILLPESGIMMNNGIMWFDPRPGRPNSMAPGARPLCNMCPLVATRIDTARGEEPWFAMGASGGRRILPAVFQGASFLSDAGLSLEAAAHQPRLNVDGRPLVEADARLAPETLEDLAREFTLWPVEAQASPNRFANLQVALIDWDADLPFQGATQIRLPVAGAVAI